ncbi:sodium:solute symporter family protein [Inquilinus sp. Marseille-Q2685]|uniref:sodium:solute symporter family protein n=1 Tax=Inquilinus sp. Marseille-Q2685 TaxID=2866581 RepID=UPI001CE41660|nr:sodium:solute symporter family protein [Inquilinus sp. Marseille-Q2685]
MDFLIGYGTLAVFFIGVILVLERTRRAAGGDFTDYAVAGRSFGSWFQAMAFLNTWLPGTIFIAFAGLAASAGVIGYYVVSYSLLAVLFMLFMAQKVFDWGRAFNLRTQADFVGMRYNSKAVRIVAALIGVVASFPWLILGFQSLGLVFSYLSFGAVSPTLAVFAGIAVLGIRQIWTVRLGMRGIVISDMVQGVFAYGVGGLVALGLIVWLMSQGLGFAALPPDFAALPGPGSGLGPLYYLSIVATGALGSWCWPDIFVRLFTARSAQAVRNSAVKAAPILLLFLAILLTMAMLAHQLPEVAAAPDNVWFLTAAHGGPFVLALAGTAVFAATAGNVNALTAAIGTHTAQDVIHIGGADEATTTRTARAAIVAATVLAVIGAILTVNVTVGLLTLALASYQGIVQLAPALYLGIFWRRGNAAAALAGMLTGFAVAVVLQLLYPVSIPELGGLTSGVVGLAVNTLVYVGLSYALPQDAAERARIDRLFRDLGQAGTDGAPVPAGGLAPARD